MKGESFSQNAILNPRKKKAPSAISCARRSLQEIIQGLNKMPVCVLRAHAPTYS